MPRWWLWVFFFFQHLEPISNHIVFLEQFEKPLTASCPQGGVVETRPVPKHVSSLDFLDLIPGHTYTITVQSLSGKLTNTNTATGRTGKTE